MIHCKSQEDLLSYRFRLTAERDLITSKTLAEHGEKAKKKKKHRVMLGGNEKVGLTRSNNRITCAGVKWHIRESISTGALEKHNVRVKVMMHLV